MTDTNDIKALIIKGLHESRIHKYKEEYKNLHGKYPSQKDINNCIAIVISTGQIERDAEDIITQFTKEARKLARIKNIAINSFLTISICSFLGLLFYILFHGKTPDFLSSGIWNITSLIAIVVITAFLIIATAISFFQKD